MEPVRFLERVTITGADNSIEPTHLHWLSRKFPFVEWGLLIHAKQLWSPVGMAPGSEMRFPSWPWLKEMAQFKVAFPGEMRFSGHVCGRWVGQFALGKDPFRAHDWPLFDRYQLNFHGQPCDFRVDEMGLALDTLDRQVVIQMDGVNDHILQSLHDRKRDVAPLFDRSHGGGVLPDEWPEGGGMYLSGYAGGLSPENVTEQLPRIHKACGGSPVWIDCETHVRSNAGRDFDLEKVEAFLTACEPWVIEESGHDDQ